MPRASTLARRYRRPAAVSAAIAVIATSLTSITFATIASAATLPATYTASSSAKLLHLNAALAGNAIADATVGLSSADVDSSRATKNSTARSANVDATVLGANLPIDSVNVSAPPTTVSAARTLLRVNLKPVADVGVISGQAQAAYLNSSACVAATNGTSRLSYARTDVAGVTLLSPNDAVNQVLSTIGINSLGSVAASWVSSETNLVNRGSGSTISDMVSTTKTSVGDITLLNNAVKVQVTNPVVLQAKSDGTTGTAGLINTPTITATIGTSVIPIPLNGSPINIELPAPLSSLVGLKITAFQPTNTSSGANAVASLQALLRIQLTVLGVLPTAPLAAVDVDLAPMTAAATAPTGGIDCKPATATITTPANGSLTTNTKPLVSGTAAPFTSVRVAEGATTICTASTDAAGNWSCTPTTALSEGTHTFTAVVTNAAGVSSDAASTTFTVDSIAPDAPSITSPADGATVTTGTPEITGSAEPNSTVVVTDGSATVCTTTADANGAWSCTPATALVDGSHTLTATSTDAAGNASAPSAPVTITVNTTISPDPTSITAPANNSTVNGSVTITGTASPTSTVTVSDGTNTVCTATTDANGNWDCVPSPALADGDYALTATATGGNASSAPSNEVHITVSNVAPEAPAITSPADGSSVGTTNPTIKGTAEPGSTVTVRDGSTIVCSAKTDANGNWVCLPIAPLTEGEHTLTATATNAAGNTSDPSAPVTITVDTTAPDAPSITAPAQNALITSHTPQISGSAEPGSTVTVTEGANTVLCQAVTSSAGDWSCTPSTSLADGTHNISATATDAAGNVSAPATSTFTIGGPAPATPVVTSPKNGSTGNVNGPKITGTGTAGSVITVREGGTTLCTAFVASNGTWSCTPKPILAPGKHTITATATKGGKSSPARTVTFTVVPANNPCEIKFVKGHATVPAHPTPACAAWLNKDSDGDGLTNGAELRGPSKKYPNCQTNPWKMDTDGDGLNDKIEITKYKTDPCHADTDGDGLSDGREVKGPSKDFPSCRTNPLSKDTDHGGYGDTFEVNHGTNPCVINSGPPTRWPERR